MHSPRIKVPKISTISQVKIPKPTRATFPLPFTKKITRIDNKEVTRLRPPTLMCPATSLRPPRMRRINKIAGLRNNQVGKTY